MAFKIAEAFVRLFVDKSEFRKGLADAQKEAGGAASQISASLGKVGTAASGTAKKIGETGSASRSARKDTSGFSESLAGELFPTLFRANLAATLTADALRAVGGGAVSAGRAVVGMYTDAMATGVRFNSMMETSQLGIASIVSTFGEFTDSQGNALTATESFAAAQGYAAKMLERAKIAAVETTATLPDLIRGMQEAVAPASSLGFTSDQVVEFTQAMTQAAGAIGLPFDQLGQELRGVLEVDLSRYSRIARLIFAGTGESAEELRRKLRQAASEGKAFDFIMERLKGFQMAGDQLALTWSGAASNLQDAFEQVMGAGTVKMTQDMTKAVLDLTDSLIVFDEHGNRSFDPQLINAIEETYTNLNMVGMVLFDIIDALSPLDTEGENTFERIASAISQSTRELAIFTGSVRELAEAPWWQKLLMLTPAAIPMWGGAYADSENRLNAELQTKELEKQNELAARFIELRKAMGGEVPLTVALYDQSGRKVSDVQSYAQDMQQALGRISPLREMWFNGSSQYKLRPQAPDADATKELSIAQQNLEIVRAQSAAAATMNERVRDQLELKASLLTVERKLAEQIKGISGKASADQAAQLEATYRAAAEAEKARLMAAASQAAGARTLSETLAIKEGEADAQRFRGAFDDLRITLGDIGKLSVANAKARGDEVAAIKAVQQTREALRQVDLDENARATALVQIQMETAQIAGQTGEVAKLREEFDRLAVAKLRLEGRNGEADALERLQGLQTEMAARRSQLAYTNAILDAERQLEDLRVESGGRASMQSQVEFAQRQLAARLQELELSDMSPEQKQALALKYAEQTRLEVANIELMMGEDWKDMLGRMSLDFGTFTQATEAMFRDMAGGMQTLFSDVLYAGFTGQLDQIDDAFKSFLKNMARRIADFYAERAVQALIQTAMSGGGWQGFVAAFMGGSTTGFANGGIAQGGINFGAFADGGIVRNPTVGLVGEGKYDEAVVPLPDGRAIEARVLQPNEAREIAIYQTIGLAGEVLAAARPSKREIQTIIAEDILHGGATYRAIRMRA